MRRFNLYVNMALALLVLLAPFALAHGLQKQEQIEIARVGQ